MRYWNSEYDEYNELDISEKINENVYNNIKIILVYIYA